MKLGIAEILKKASEQPTRDEKIDMLRKHDTPALRTLVKYALDPSIKWDLPKGKPPFKPIPYLDQEGRLYSEVRRLYLFVEGGNPNLSKVKREALFIQLLESITPADAELLCAVKDKKIPYKGLTAKIFQEAFPGLIDEQVTE